MCAGASTYEALQAAGTKPSDRVGVVGIGGLGHMANVFARAMGYSVTAVTRDEYKYRDLFRLGADEVRIDRGGTLDLATFPSSVGGELGPTYGILPDPMHIDVLLITSNAVRDLEACFPLLARRAKIVLMTIQTDPIKIPYMPFILPGHRLVASTEASHHNHFEMLEFVESHRIEPLVETFPMTLEGAMRAFDRLEKGEMRYRGVLVREDEEQTRKRRREYC